MASFKQMRGTENLQTKQVATGMTSQRGSWQSPDVQLKQNSTPSV